MEKEHLVIGSKKIVTEMYHKFLKNGTGRLFHSDPEYVADIAKQNTIYAIEQIISELTRVSHAGIMVSNRLEIWKFCLELAQELQ